MAKKQRLSRFAICVHADGADDLALRRIYRVLPDRKGELHGYLRIVDESGEDYLYAAKRFVLLEVPQTVGRKFLPRATIPARKNGALPVVRLQIKPARKPRRQAAGHGVG